MLSSQGSSVYCGYCSTLFLMEVEHSNQTAWSSPSSTGNSPCTSWKYLYVYFLRSSFYLPSSNPLISLPIRWRSSIPLHFTHSSSDHSREKYLKDSFQAQPAASSLTTKKAKELSFINTAYASVSQRSCSAAAAVTAVVIEEDQVDLERIPRTILTLTSSDVLGVWWPQAEEQLLLLLLLLGRREQRIIDWKWITNNTTEVIDSQMVRRCLYWGQLLESYHWTV